MLDRIAPFAAVHIDIGTGDGAFVYRSARARPDTLFVGVDANAGGLAEVSRRAAAKPARGGLCNALFVQAPVESLPSELEGLATGLSVLLPWGSLLRAVAAPNPALLGALRGLCRDGASVEVLMAYDPGRDGRAFTEAGAPELTPARVAGELAAAYRRAAFDVRGREVDRDEVARLPTTWAKKLCFAGTARRFFALEGRAA